MKLKPNTTYSFSKSDLEFVCELAKVGHVHLLSDQVSVIQHNASGGANISFKEYGGGGDKQCFGLKLPDNWVIEWIGCDAECKYLKITFGVK